MIASIVIASVTFAVLMASILFFPSFKVGRVRIATYWIIALVGAIILLAAKLVPFGEFWHHLTASSAINPLTILVLFVSMTFLSVYLDEVGLFRYLASKAAHLGKANQTLLFTVMYALVAILTVFTSNDIVILTFTPFICFFCKNAKINPIPYLVAEFAAANTWSMALVIGNPTNIYLATSTGIAFGEYFKVMALPTVAAGVIEFGLMLLVFWKALRKPLEYVATPVVIESKPDLVVGGVHLGICLVFLVIADYIHIPMWMVSAVAAGSLVLSSLVIRLITRKGWAYLGHSAARLPWQLIPFVLSMFCIVICWQYQGVSAAIGKWLGNKACIWTYGASSFLAANLINNIPMSILFATLPQGLGELAARQAVFATVIGSNLGAFLTPVGALAGIMFTDLTRRYEVGYGFGKFVAYGALFSLPTLAVALGVLCLMV
ncbi:MAG: hypothetical protein J5755_00845 [Clostridia bacterium]|nr:hypothetical protein [Clostridia bacterium]